MSKLTKKTQEHLLSIDDVIFYFDFNALGDFVKIDTKNIKKPIKDSETNEPLTETDIVIDVSKYEMIRFMVETLMTYGDSLGSDMDEVEKMINKVNDFDNTPLAFKLAFNTLLFNKILVKYEPTS